MDLKQIVLAGFFCMTVSVGFAQQGINRTFLSSHALTASELVMAKGLKAGTLSPRLTLNSHVVLDYEQDALIDEWADMTTDNTDTTDSITYAPLCSTVPSTGCALTTQNECNQNTLPQGCNTSANCNVTSVSNCTKAALGCNKLTLPSACNGVTSVTNCTKAAAWCNVFTLPSACATSESGCFTNAGNCSTTGQFCQTITVKSGNGCTNVPAVCNATFNSGNSCAATKNLNCINTQAAACATSQTPNCSQTSYYACQQTFGLSCLTFKGVVCATGPVQQLQSDDSSDFTNSGLTLVLLAAVAGLFASFSITSSKGS